jgi:hypothetical protein
VKDVSPVVTGDKPWTCHLLQPVTHLTDDFDLIYPSHLFPLRHFDLCSIRRIGTQVTRVYNTQLVKLSFVKICTLLLFNHLCQSNSATQHVLDSWGEFTFTRQSYHVFQIMKRMPPVLPDKEVQWVSNTEHGTREEATSNREGNQQPAELMCCPFLVRPCTSANTLRRASHR